MMKKRKIHSKTSYIQVGMVLLFMVLAAFTTSFTVIPEFLRKDPIKIQFDTEKGIVDLDKGISKDTEKLFVSITEGDDPNLKYKPWKMEATLVTDGVDQWTIFSYREKQNIIFTFGDKLNQIENESALVVKVTKYITLNEFNQVNWVDLEKPLLFNIPIY